MTVTSVNIWANEMKFDENVVRQLLVPAANLELLDEHDGIWLTNQFGRWPARRSEAVGPSERLTATIPTIPAGVVRASWSGDRSLLSPELVLSSYEQAIGFRSPDQPRSLRRPQIGALHSVIGYWSSGLKEPGIVVMPTGTGKTETMLALFVAARPKRLLVVVPTAALRDQIAGKFESLGILQEHEIVESHAMRPAVARLEHGLKEVRNARDLVAASNVVVATPAAIAACAPEARDELLDSFTHLVVDEAHHAPAPTWATVIDRFAGRPVLLFTATPYREDGKAIPGRTIFRFPLREAQADGYFTRIEYRAVLSLGGTDGVLADLALERLRADLEAGHDHILMARARTVNRAEELLRLYRDKAPELSPELLHERLSTTRRRAILQALDDRISRVIVCVDMLGEGFDLPSLKVAAIHDLKKSLSPMIQLIGRFSRTSESSRIGTASVFVARDPTVRSSPLRDLLVEDADWNLLLSDITERASEAVEDLTAFESSFAGAPEDVPVSLLEPKMSAIAYRSSTRAWEPNRVLDEYDESSVLDGRLALGADSTVAWLVIQHRDDVRWGSVQALEQVTYELVILYFDSGRRLLYIYSSENSGDYSNLASAVLGEQSSPIAGPQTFRVLAYLDRLIPTNVGLLDARDHFNRFSMHVGSDVMEALELADRQGKSQTHIATSGYSDGERVTISAAMSGRFWSMQSARNIREWTEWCDRQGPKLLDDHVDLDQVLAGFILPEDLSERPSFVLLGLEWPWQLFTGLGPGVLVSHEGASFPVTDVDFVVDDFSDTGPFFFSLTTPSWSLGYWAEFLDSGLTYYPRGDDAQVASRPSQVPMQTWINRNKPTLFLQGDRMITPEDRLLAPRTDLAPFDRARLSVLDWEGVDIRAESQGAERRQDSIQAYMSRYMQDHATFDILIDDDRSGEAADLVGISVDGAELSVTLIHCKYSSQSTPGARLADLYDLCGQAVRGAKWRQHGAEPLLRHLDRRAQAYASRTGLSPFEVGGIDDLYRIRVVAPQLRPRFTTIVAQPGLSASVCSDEQLRLLAGADSYVRAVTKGAFLVHCST
jgi:superfamily II DNA or RNA helicase